MRIIIAFLLLLVSHFSLAQPVILKSNSREAKELSSKLEKEYANDGGLSGTPFSISSKFNAACAEVLQSARLNYLAVRAAVYLNAQGKVDYLIFSLEQTYRPAEYDKEKPIPFDSLSTVLQAQLQPFANELVSQRTIGSKTVLGVHAYLMKEPERVPADSIVFGVEALSKTTDTLKVVQISLGQNLLTTIPSSIYRFPNVKRIFLNDNDIEAVDLDLSRLPKLEQIDLTGNILREDQIQLSKNKSLKMLNLLKNQLHDIPAAVKNCKGLETLWLGSNDMNKLSNKGFKRAKRVKDLNFYKANIAVLPKGIKKLKKLQVLDLYHNNLEALPTSITKLRSLTHLAIAHNQIQALPQRMDKLSKVHTFYAHHNHLSKLPKEIEKMKNLAILDLGYNWFTQFPEPLTSFVNLQELDLSSNNFPEFPEQLLKISKLEKLYLRGNPFISADTETKYSQQLTVLKNKNIEVFY